MTRHPFFLLILILCVQVSPLLSQEDVAASRWKLRADFFHQDLLVQFPIGSLGVYQQVSLRPGAALSGEYTWLEKGNKRLYQSVKIGYYNNLYEERWGMLGTELGVEFKLFRRWLIAPRSGIHYNLVKPTDIQYEFVDGLWTKAKNPQPAFSRVQIGIGLDLGYRLSEGNHPIDILLNGNVSISGPYVNSSSLSTWTYQAAGIGLRVGW